MHDETDLYRQMMALHAKDFHTCFYCGCIATKNDRSPPLKYAEFYLRTREEADFYQIPACNECFDFLRSEKSGALAQRVDKVKQKLARKYKKAIRIYEMWDHDEIDELDYHLKKSVNAGLELGKECYERLKFKGFEFEADGEKHSVHYVETKVFTVFGEKFDSFRDALDYGSKAFRIPKAKLREIFAENGNCFDTAIKIFQDEMARKIYERELKDKCKIFADKHKQNIKFVMHTVEIYMSKDEKLTIDTALLRLFEERFKQKK
ncbi:hypothetical protein JEU11_13450 [Paraglaciecola chathamensis]|uniref:Orphan protein n=1 Tax=Paraglaciecola chathamensis TaxID=368405 RepID=A0ABS0WG61_9ALTE|nr:hypothetical protein [Paraglaciecola chathamensis]MBJ2137461.1 hypothetical protein [Paraglaciecola chathamensis]